MKSITNTTLLILLVIGFSGGSSGQAPELQTDITFVVVGKTGNFRQSVGGTVSALNYHFFAEIFVNLS